MPGKIPDGMNFNIDMSDAAVARPRLAVLAARLFAGWANVEMTLGAMASVLIGDAAALALLDQLRSNNQKLDGIRATASERITHEETRDLMKPLFKLIGSAARTRNQFAHCLWGTIEQLPDALLLTQPNSALKAKRLVLGSPGGRSTNQTQNGEELSFEHNSSTQVDLAEAVFELLHQGTEAWKEEDFLIPQTLINRAIVALTIYTVAISAPPTSPEAVAARKQLHDLLKETEQLH